MSNNSSRNATLDLLKLLASYMVVFIHVPFYGKLGIIISAVSRCAVPIFFLSSGFFCYQNSTNKISKKTASIFKILIFTSLLYNLTNIASLFLSDGVSGISEYSSMFLDLNRWFDLLIFNIPFSATRIWFLFALIYVYTIQWLMQKLKVDINIIFIFSILLLSLNIILVEGLSLFNITLPEHLTRNFLFTGYPFFGIGMFLKKHEAKIYSKRALLYVSGILIGTAITLVSLKLVGEKVLYLGSVFISLNSFALAIKYSDITYHPNLVRIFGCSLSVYIFHKPITTALSLFLRIVSINENSVIYMVLMPILVCVFSTLTGLLLQIIIERISHKSKLIKHNKTRNSTN